MINPGLRDLDGPDLDDIGDQREDYENVGDSNNVNYEDKDN